ncbi:MAG: hypothetical protein FWD78_03020 [Treponema sp.]|nr:hypothetical protein [Treponema sp.]
MTEDAVEIFKKLDPENQASLMSHIKIAYIAQENTKKRFGLLAQSSNSINSKRSHKVSRG